MENNNRQGCRWVKASERLPDLTQYSESELHFRFDGKKVCGVQFMSDGFEVKILSIYHGFYNKDLHRLEWLDESIEPCATSSDAIEFADWIDINLMMGNRLNRLKDGTKKWFYNHSPEKKQGKQNWISYTTEQLYQIYKSQTPSPTGDRDCEELKAKLKAAEERLAKMGNIDNWE